METPEQLMIFVDISPSVPFIMSLLCLYYLYNFEHISDIALVFAMLNLKKQILDG